MKRCIVALLLLLPLPAHAFTAYVTKIADGDTFTVMADGHKTRVRIFGIDAPEHDQPYGDKATADLSALILHKTVDIEPPPHKRGFPKSYDRIVGVARIDGSDVGWTMISLGDAWAYEHFHPPITYDTAQMQAEAVRAGLWWDDHPLPPWDWRRFH